MKDYTLSTQLWKISSDWYRFLLKAKGFSFENMKESSTQPQQHCNTGKHTRFPVTVDRLGLVLQWSHFTRLLDLSGRFAASDILGELHLMQLHVPKSIIRNNHLLLLLMLTERQRHVRSGTHQAPVTPKLQVNFSPLVVQGSSSITGCCVFALQAQNGNHQVFSPIRLDCKPYTSLSNTDSLKK